MINTEHFLSLSLNWLLTYGLHSSVLLGIAALCQQCGLLKSHRLSELVWRTALFGGLITSLLFCGFSFFLDSRSPASPPLTTPTLAPALVSTALVNTSSQGNNTTDHQAIQEPLRLDLPAYSPQHSPTSSIITSLATQNQLNSSEIKTSWELTAKWKFWFSTGLLLWLVYAVLILVKTYLSVRYLHRLVASMPVVQRPDLQNMLQRLAPQANIQIHACHEHSWSSPFVCPNGAICMPTWTLQNIEPEQTYAMLAHEVQHVLRADGQWRIAQQLLTSIFFFQIFNRYANRQLHLLAEIDCDYSAIQDCSVEHYSRSLLRCAEMLNPHHPPVFAMPMAKASSLLHRINLLFDEDTMHTLNTNTHIRQNKIRPLTLGALALISLSGMSYALPTFKFTSEHLPLSVSSKPAQTPVVSIDTTNSSSSTVLLTAPITAQTNTQLIEQTTEYAPPQPSVSNSHLAAETVTMPSTSSTLPSNQNNSKLLQAQTAYQNKDFALALQLYKELAESGNAEAQFAAGEMLWRGEGSQVQAEAAMVLLKQAANQGQLQAQKYVALFAERAQHQSEINFYTQQFDGGKLKWTEQTCERPELSSILPSAKEYSGFINKMNANLSCYNNYVASLKQSLSTGDYLNVDLRRLMRNDEIEKTKQLVQNIYFDMGMQAMQQSQKMLTEFDKQNEIWRSEIKVQKGRDIELSSEMERSHFQRLERRPVEVETGERNTITFTNLKEK